MSEDIQTGPTSRQPKEPWQERPEGPKPDLQRPPYPKTIIAAGVLMIVAIGLMLVGSGLRVPVIMLPMLVAFCLLFIWQAIRFLSATSTVKDTRGVGVRLVVCGSALSLFTAYLEYLRQTYVGAPVPVPFPANLLSPCYILAGAAMLLAGVLFRVGRAPYRAWFDAKNARKNGTPKEGEA